MAYVGSHVRIRGKQYLHLGQHATLEPYVRVDAYGREGVTIGARSRVGAYTVISCTSHLSLFGKGFRLGDDSGLGEFGFVGSAGGVWVGDNVIMGQYVSFHSQEHQFGDRTRPIRSQGSTEQGIVVENDCWIGARVTILDGTHIGPGCVVAAGAVVKGTFPAHSILAGVPARVMQDRRAKHEENH